MNLRQFIQKLKESLIESDKPIEEDEVEEEMNNQQMLSVYNQTLNKKESDESIEEDNIQEEIEVSA